MKKSCLLLILILAFAIKNTSAQNPVATLLHNGQTQFFYNNTALTEAFNAAVNNDTIYLSSGTFNALTINKRITIIGKGHYPDSTIVFLRTKMASVMFGQGSDYSKIEGVYFNGNVEFAVDKPLKNITISRCSMQDFKFNTTSQTASKDYCEISQSVIRGSVFCSNYCISFYIKNCILENLISDISGNSNGYFKNNIFVYQYWNNGSGILRNINNSLFHDNIIFQIKDSFSQVIDSKCNNNNFTNNIFQSSLFDFGTNNNRNNFFAVAPISNIFVRQEMFVFNYLHDYHLKNPSTYLGSDGTQVGIYGGDTPFKEKALPSNPQIISNSIAPSVDSGGNLKVNITVKAQNN